MTKTPQERAEKLVESRLYNGWIACGDSGDWTDQEAIRNDIAAAIREAVKEERDRIFSEYHQRTGDDLGFFIKDA